MSEDKSDGLAPFGEGAASWVVKKWREADTVLTDDRRNYWLNSAFYEGDQWVFWSPNNEVAEFPRANGRVHTVVNKFQPNVITNHARLTKRNLVFEVLPTGADDATVHSAHLADHLIRAEHRDSAWEKARKTNLINVDFGGTSAIMVEWNPQIGDPLGEDPETGEIILSGNPQLTPLSICEFTLEPGTQHDHESRYLLVCRAFTPEQAKEAFGLSFAPKPDAQTGVGPLQRKLTSRRTGNSQAKLCLVYTYYERPSANNQQGRHLVVINGEAVIDDAWPFPFDHLNAYVFRQQVMPKKWTGETYLNQARYLQVQLNMAQSLIIETMKMAGNARLAIPDNAGIQSDDLTDTPGEIIYYDGTSSAPPQYISPAMVPAWMFEQVNVLKGDIDDIMFVHGISRGQAPGDRNSGLALTVLAEKDETPLGLMAHDQAEGWASLAGMVLELWEANVTELRKSVVQTAPGAPPLSRLWNGAHLRGQTKVNVPLEAVMPYSRAAQQAWVSQLAQQFPGMPQWSDFKFMSRALDLPGAESMILAADADVAKAELEAFLIATGDVVLPETFDDHAKHIAEHNDWRKSTAYMYAEPVVRRTMDQHIIAHMKMAMEEMANQAGLEQQAPGASTVPQDNAPPGSNVPPSSRMQAAGAPMPGPPMAGPNPNAGGQAIPGAQPPPEMAAAANA